MQSSCSRKTRLPKQGIDHFDGCIISPNQLLTNNLEACVDFWHAETIPDALAEEKKPGWHRTLLDTLETLILSLALFLAINTISERIRVESISMQPTLFPGDYVIVNKLAYRFNHAPQRGDVIVFKYPPDPEAIPYIKRVIGLPGDQIHIADGKVYINGQLMLEPWLKVTTNRGGDWSVPERQLFVMGDNRNNSSDSRSWGFVPLGNIIGRAELIYLPPQHWAFLHRNLAVASPEP
jgi:signal peptidase I